MQLLLSRAFIIHSTMSLGRLTGSLTGTGASADTIALRGWFNLTLSGTWSATVAVQSSFDNGSTWDTVESFETNIRKRGYETEAGVIYRINCTAYTSGTINYRLSR